MPSEIDRQGTRNALLAAATAAADAQSRRPGCLHIAVACTLPNGPWPWQPHADPPLGRLWYRVRAERRVLRSVDVTCVRPFGLFVSNDDAGRFCLAAGCRRVRRWPLRPP